LLVNYYTTRVSTMDYQSQSAGQSQSEQAVDAIQL
jgi:hypothetical protein